MRAGNYIEQKKQYADWSKWARWLTCNVSKDSEDL